MSVEKCQRSEFPDPEVGNESGMNDYYSTLRNAKLYGSFLNNQLDYNIARSVQFLLPSARSTPDALRSAAVSQRRVLRQELSS